MGMTIDEAISHLDTYSSTLGSGQTPQAKHEESKRVSIETMRKYQKIEKIYNDYLNDMITNIYADGKFIKALSEVLGDDRNND